MSDPLRAAAEAMCVTVKGGMTAEIVPLTLAQARRYVAEHHRHNEPPIGHRFSIGLQRDDKLVGVVIAGHPIARAQDDGRTIELVRLTTEGDRNACSRLYSAACRAAFAMGYIKVITYTLESEPGSSLLASGFVQDGVTKGYNSTEWFRGDTTRKARGGHGMVPMLFEKRMPTGPKRRWVRVAALQHRVQSWPTSTPVSRRTDHE